MNRTLTLCIITRIPPVYTGETQEHGGTPGKGPSQHLKYHFQLKAKDKIGGKDRPVLGDCRERHLKQGKVVTKT